MIRDLSPSMRRLLALLILALVVGVIGWLAWLPVDALRRQEQTIADLATRTEQFRERLGTREQMLAEQRLLQRASEADQTLVQGATPALVGAELQKVLSGLVQDGGGRLESVQVLEPVEEAPFVRIGLRLTFSSSIEGLRSFLYAVEQHAPVLLVEEMTIYEAPQYDDSGNLEANQLSTTVEIAGYARAQAAS
ncbi:MAG: type II secretion system protein GspM [Geminicoccaceae bacterium]